MATMRIKIPTKRDKNTSKIASWQPQFEQIKFQTQRFFSKQALAVPCYVQRARETKEKEKRSDHAYGFGFVL